MKELIKKMGMTRKSFAKWLGAPQRTVEDWCDHDTCKPYIKELIKFKVDAITAENSKKENKK